MNKNILNTVIQEFISDNVSKDVTSFLLESHHFEGASIKEIVEQIEAKKRCKLKLPTWYNNTNIYYPNKLNIEQTSSEVTAKYKSEIISGNSIIDLTGGFGVDCYYFSKVFKNVTHCELNKELSEIAKHNFQVLNAENVENVNTDGISYFLEKKKKYDWIYIDPSRRNDIKGKVFYLKDCLPNVPEHLDLLFNYSDNILIKVSPMLDLSIGISELQHVKNIHIVAVNNEVKEVLFVLERDCSLGIEIKTVNFQKEKIQEFSFLQEKENEALVNFEEVQSYLYEPNAAILKSGAFKSVAQILKTDKLHQHSHLYTSESLLNFPGRSFIVEKVVPYNKRKIKSILEKQQINVSTRNFPESVIQLKKKFKFKDGGDDYVFFTTNHNNEKVVIFCKKA
ncbi:class I SAM-dependent methyltransferase [Flavobacteriaceae sp. LMIT009]